jgi:nitrogen-specific signal transduction histidine kinase
VTRSGRTLDVLITISTLLDEAGTAETRWLCAVHDVSERKRLEEQFRHAQKMEAVGRLAGGVAHDFNNLLTAILGYTELLLEPAAADAPPRDELLEIKRAAESAAAVTRQLLTFSRRHAVHPQALDLAAVVRDMRDLIQRTIGDDVRLDLDLADVPVVWADRGQIEQVILNLAVNARDAMPTGGTLTIGTSSLEHYAVLMVRDDGVGMTADIKAHLFEPFFTTKSRGNGTGLGLSIVYSVAAQLGGRVEFESEPGDGATFAVYIPATDVTAAAPDTRPVVPRLNGAGHVLVVDDDTRVRTLVERVLKGAGYHVSSAPHGPAAIVVANGHDDIELLVTDVVMPGISGPELARRLNATLPRLKTVFISGYTDDLLRQHGVDPDSLLLQKPFTPAELLAAIRRASDGGPEAR